MRVEVVYALPDVCHAAHFELAPAATVADAVAAARHAPAFAGLDLASAAVGVFGIVASPATPLADGDRVEFYRPLARDPKARRRALAADSRRADGPAG